MAEVEGDFPELIRRVRLGDASAAEELLRLYEPMIRLRIRTWLRLRNPELRRAFDSMDICQSVMGNFFVRVAAGQFDLGEPAQLLGLLTVMARNRLGREVKYHQSMRRDIRRTQPIGADPIARDVADASDRVASGRELLVRFREGLTEEERRLADARAAGQAWSSIAEELGGTPEGRRKQWARAVERMAERLGLGKVGEGEL